MGKFIITEEEKNSIRKMYLIETGEDPVDPVKTSNPPKLDSKQSDLIKSFLWNKIITKPELKHGLGLNDSHNEHNFLDAVGHNIHAHFNPSTKHMQLEFPSLGKNHNFEIDLGLSLKNTHGDDHHANSFNTNHSVFDVGVKIPLTKLLN